jgi:transcriptional adapter 3
MKPGPKKQSEVSADYSQTKAPSQVGFPTWWNTVEPYIREIREEDLAMLTLKASGILSTSLQKEQLLTRH